jgi:hypothetical protein
MNTLRECLVEPPLTKDAVDSRSLLLYGQKFEDLDSSDAIKELQLSEEEAFKQQDILNARNKFLEELKEKYKSQANGKAYVALLEEARIQAGGLTYGSGGQDTSSKEYLSLFASEFEVIMNNIESGVEELRDYQENETEFYDHMYGYLANTEFTRVENFDTDGNLIDAREYNIVKDVFDITAKENSQFLEDFKLLYSDEAAWSKTKISSENKETVTTRTNDRYRLALHSKVLKEYLTGLENRFVPFRRYHQIRSDRDIIRNNISLSTRKAVNAVNVYYEDYSGDEPTVKSLFMKASSAISDMDLNTANLDTYQRNVRSKAMALR